MSLKVTKIRSLENAVYKDSYNRVRFQISADDMATDMSESYLSMKLFIVNGLTGKAYTKEEILNLDKSKVMFSFGSSLGEAYSPACLIKTARLFSMMGELTLLEEINYCNVLTQTLNNFAKDFESLSAESLMTMASTGSLMMSSVGAGCGSYFGAELSLSDQSVQVNIKLSDIFGICKTNNFHLSMTGGLQIELELEDTHPLIQQRVAVDLVNPLPEVLNVVENGIVTGTTRGFSPDYSTSARCIRAVGQNLFSNSANLLASSRTLIEKPESYKYDSSYVRYVVPGPLVDTANLVPNEFYEIQNLSTLTEAEWTAIGAPVPGGPEEYIDTANLVPTSVYTVKVVGALTPLNWNVAGGAINLNDNVDTGALVPGAVYKVKDVGALTPLNWNVAGGAINAGDLVDTSAIQVGVSYIVQTVGTTLTLANWNTAGWEGAVLPVVGDTFVGKAVTVTGGSLSTLTSPPVGHAFVCIALTVAGGKCDTLTNPIVGTVFTALAPTITGGTVFIDNKQKIGQRFRCLAVGPAGGKCYNVDIDGKMKNTVGGSSDVIQLADNIKWTLAQMNDLYMKVGKQIKIFWKITQPNHLPRFFHHINTIKERVPAVDPLGAKLVLENSYTIPNYTGTHLQNAVVEFDHFEIVSEGLDLVVSHVNANWENLQKHSFVEMTPLQVQELQSAGLLSAGTGAQILAGKITELRGSSQMVSLAVDVVVDDNVSIYPDVYDNADIPSLRKLFSNQSVKLPSQGGLVAISKAVRLNTGNFNVFFSGLGLENNNSLQNSAMVVPRVLTPNGPVVTAGLGVITTATKFNLHFWNVKEPSQTQPGDEMVIGQSYIIKNVGTATQAQWTASGNDEGLVPAVGQSFICKAPLVGNGLVAWVPNNKAHNSYKSPTWEITKAELVLVQTEKNGMPPASIYSTVRVEAVTIENELESYNRQFVVAEPNCFSVLLCSPFYRDGVSLVSHSRNIQNYRWSINNIDNTNRNIIVETNTSKFPSTLHLDKFMDTMNNDVSPVASLSGVNGVSRSALPPVVFPLKIYSASDAESQYLNPMSGYTLQFAGYGDETHNKRIIPGPVFLFKYCFKTL